MKAFEERFPEMIKCPHCGGVGKYTDYSGVGVYPTFIPEEKDCIWCRGKGKIKDNFREMKRKIWEAALEWALKQRIAVFDNDGTYLNYDIVCEELIEEELNGK